MVVNANAKTQSLTCVDYIFSLFICVGHCDFSLYITLSSTVPKFYWIRAEWQVETDVYIMLTLLTHKYCSSS